ncbi:serine protease Do [Hathewaya proteolytica DSM 3090]|uniref:Serine protease Do n=1 Tax=Hathewaya proteolytica DSM 3090 TaxID=1121331 RepID=A0A1M6RP93_9CLOT|nr:trypsin-like peptidase domain-containing protein [Hathewaya proteolytica]SHK34292.1 serine protease Do [Hathewaya proteolytica DSM 3090]
MNENNNFETNNFNNNENLNNENMNNDYFQENNTNYSEGSYNDMNNTAQFGDSSSYNSGSYDSQNTNYQYNMANGHTVNEKVKKPKKPGSGKFKTVALLLVACLLSGTIAGGGAAYFTAKHYNNEVLNSSNGLGGSKTPVLAESLVAKNNDTLTIPEINQKVGPAVVGITTKTLPQNYWGFIMEGQSGVGSGVILDENGYILTNNHVIANAQSIKVTFKDGKEVEAKLINSDPSYDLAVIKVTDTSVKMPGVAELGDSDSIIVGETAVAIGNPLGLELSGSVSAGIVSAVDRAIDAENKDLKFIQTDAAINPGNSGGPLVNSRGQVIGINTQKTVGNGVEGLGFAIPINQIKSKFKELMTPKVMIGISTRDIDEAAKAKYNLPIGVYVASVEQYSAAEKAGIQIADVIVKVNGKAIKTGKELNAEKAKFKAGDTLSLTLIRDGKEKLAKVTLQ